LLSPVLFEGFSDTMRLSDSLYPFVMAVPLPGSSCGPRRNQPRPNTGPPDSRAKSFYACMRSPTPPRPYIPCHCGLYDIAFCILEEHRHVDLYLLRGSILSVWNIPIYRGTFPCQRFTDNVTITNA
jgi:hypothetical protein